MVTLMSTTIIPGLVENAQTPLHAVVVVLELFLAVTYIVCTSTDPADPAVVRKWKRRNDPIQVKDDPDDEGYCEVCELIGEDKSLHCNKCNKCVKDFDHHCTWINNCIGSRNYRWFIAMIVLGVVYFAMAACIGIVQLVSYLHDRKAGVVLHAYHNIDPDQDWHDATFHIMFMEVPKWVWLLFTAACVFVSVGTVRSIVIILHFHFRLWLLNMSTYEYLMKERLEKKRIERELEAMAIRQAEKASSEEQVTDLTEHHENATMYNIDEIMSTTSSVSNTACANPVDLPVVKSDFKEF